MEQSPCSPLVDGGRLDAEELSDFRDPDRRRRCQVVADQHLDAFERSGDSVHGVYSSVSTLGEAVSELCVMAIVPFI